MLGTVQNKQGFSRDTLSQDIDFLTLKLGSKKVHKTYTTCHFLGSLEQLERFSADLC